MARINTNIPAVVAQRTLLQTQRDLQVSLERLSSGLRINRGADDPAGLINSEALRAEIAGLEKAVSNSQRAMNIIATTESSLDETASLLIDVQGLIVEMANRGALSPEEIEANQLQIDNAVKSITRIANTAQFAGRKLLDGSLDYSISGVNSNSITMLNVHQANFGSRAYIPVAVEMVTTAEKAELQFRSSQATLASNVSIEVTGNAGVTTINLVAGAPLSSIVTAINAQTESNGVEATLLDGDSNPATNSGISFRSVEYGTDQFVRVSELPGSGSFSTVDATGSSVIEDHGTDAVAIINGTRSTGRGLDLVMNTTMLEMTVRVDENFASGATTSFSITGGGALFQLGPDVNPNQQVNMAVQSVAASRLGDATVGFLSQIVKGADYEAARSVTNTGVASNIVTEAIRQVSVLRGRLGAFERNTLQTNINSQRIALENLTASESAIRDTDFAYETSRLTRAQILLNAGTAVLAIANTSSQNVLSLLGG